MNRPRGIYVLDTAAYDLVYGLDERQEIARRVDLIAPAQTSQSVGADPAVLRDATVLFSGWGAPVMDEAFLDNAPNLRAVFYAGGAVGSWITAEVWDRGIVVTSAYAANAVPVAEYTMATIVFSLKHGWALARQTREQRLFPPRDGAPGCYGTTVGLVSLGITARTLAQLLRPFEMNVLAYDPYVSPGEAAELGVGLTSLDDLFERCHVVSIHTPLLDETIGMITGAHVASM
jgi:phosphoglycerate dehydrogenase-like enzyme